MKGLLFISILLFHLVGKSAVFYSPSQIPDFNPNEKEILNDFGIRFRQFKENSSIKKHNKGVSDLILTYGDHWTDSLVNRFNEPTKEVTHFFKNLYLFQSIEVRKKDIRVYYKKNGIITSISTSKSLRNDGGGMFHRRLTTETFDIKGKRIDKKSRTTRGSGCCFTADTDVMCSQNFSLPIAELKVNQEILTYDTQNDRLVTAIIKEVKAVPHKDLYQLNFEGFSITTTADHPFWLKNGWGAISPKQANLYLNGGSCLIIDLNVEFSVIRKGKVRFIKLKSIEQKPSEKMTYTITKLDGGNTFIANSLIVGVENVN